MKNTPDASSDAKPTEPATPSRPSRRKSILALSIFALGLNASAAVYTMSPADFALPNASTLAELLPLQRASDATPDPVVAALKDMQSAQQQHAALLQENSSSLQQSTALLQQDSTTLAALRESITDEQVDMKKMSAEVTDEHADVKKMSAQLSTLIAKVDTLQTSIAPELTSSIPKGHARARISGVTHKRMAKPVSIGAAPHTMTPALILAPQQSPEG